MKASQKNKRRMVDVDSLNALSAFMHAAEMRKHRGLVTVLRERCERPPKSTATSGSAATKPLDGLWSSPVAALP